MSDPKLISPLLDGFMMGSPISSHNGVRCCPAMNAESSERYIVKVISVPAAQSKLEALLLAGAFSGKDDAIAYFEDLSKDITDEAALLQRLSVLEGFSAYDGWQVIPMEDGQLGYDVYLIGPYRKTLARFLRREPMTHLAAVNLGLDICAALSVARRNGYLYVDLKPDNIFITPEREYKIADLGFVKLSSLNFASLPDRYLSSYTAPEITDAYSSLNDTLDTYAAGLVLYQVYNNGQLPFEDRANEEPLPPPQYADYEMAQIILKACDPDPAKRWEDPMQMGQALVSYLQRNSINDDPIVPPVVAVEPELPQEVPAEAYSDEEEPSTEAILEEASEALASVGMDQDQQSAAAQSAEPEVTEAPAETEEPLQEPVSEEETAQAESSEEASTEEEGEDPEADMPLVAGIYEEITPNDLGVTDEVSRILAQADDLIAHETPDPVIAPEPIDVPIPDPIILPKETPEESEAESAEDTAQEEPEAPQGEAVMSSEDAQEAEDEDDVDAPRRRKSHKGLILTLIAMILVAALGIGAKYYYDNYYLQPVLGVSVSGEEDKMTVIVDSGIQDGLLTAVCTDSYGNKSRKEIVNGRADFINLQPDTRYNITLEITGYHKLVGNTTGSYTTPGQTAIHGISIVTGKEDSEVILSFTVQGIDSNEWTVLYTAEGEAARSAVFKGHMLTLSGLTPGKTYTFTLEPVTPLYLIGENSAQFAVTGVLSAQNLAIQGFRDGALSVTWDAPDPSKGTVESWTVRCYNDAGYDKTITVTYTQAQFEEADPAYGYTVEVTAAGMSIGTRSFVSAASVTIHEVTTDLTDPSVLRINWVYDGPAPEGGWLVLYTMGSDPSQHVVSSSTNSAIITPVVPGTDYHISVRPAGGNTVFGGSTQCKSPESRTFSGYGVDASNVVVNMCRTPANENWLMSDVPAEDFVTSFLPGESASFAATLNHEYDTSPQIVTTLFVIRDGDGNIVSTATQSRSWTSMWYRGFGRINIPSMPGTPGSYTLELYWNNMYVFTQSFSVVSAQTNT